MSYEQNQGRSGGYQRNNETNAIVVRVPDEVVKAQGKYTDLDALADGMKALQARANVLAPVSRISALPPGHALTLSVVQIDPRESKDGGDCYSVDGGKLALGKAALDRIAAAVGIDWDPKRSGRLDDGSDPHYCHFRAVGILMDLDGSRRTISGEVEIDLRDGSPATEEIRRQAAVNNEKAARGEKNKWGKPIQRRDPENQISQIRAFILRHAESKAKNRAIRSAVGLRSAFTPADLQKPFVAPKLVFTGDFGDAEINRAVALRIADRALGLGGPAEALYGPGRTLPQPETSTIDLTGPARHAPPPVGEMPAGHVHDDDDAPPADVFENEAIPFYELPADAQVQELAALAGRKGKLGDGPGLLTKAAIEGFDDQNRERLWKKLCALPAGAAPAAPAPKTDGNGQTLPDWAA